MASRPNQDYAVSNEHRIWLQVGSKLFPEYPINGLAEAMSQLRNCWETI